MTAEENDRLRRSVPAVLPPSLLVMTRGVASLPPDEVAEIMTKVRDFDEFNEDNDPWKQHDFGSFQHNGHKIFWKIDDYGGAEGYDLVLTGMLADEY